MQFFGKKSLLPSREEADRKRLIADYYTLVSYDGRRCDVVRDGRVMANGVTGWARMDADGRRVLKERVRVMRGEAVTVEDRLRVVFWANLLRVKDGEVYRLPRVAHFKKFGFYERYYERFKG